MTDGVRVCVVDHHDSYTWNLVHLIAGVTGDLPVVVQHDEVSAEELLDHCFSHLVLSPGPGTPNERADFSVGRALLLHSRVQTDPGQSAFARFVGAHAGVGDTEWLPGRLALRWTVETNGFDIERWIDAGSSASRGEDDAFLVATRTERTPSLILATPVPVDGPSQKRGGV